MPARAFWRMAWTLAAAIPLTPTLASPQQTAAETRAGIWIADAAGRLREVEPGPASFLRAAPRPAPSVRVVLAVDNFAHSATGALSAGELAVARVVGALSRLGVAGDDIVRETARVRPEYERRGVLARSGEPPRLRGFHAVHVIVVRAPGPHRLGLLVDLAIGAGATRVLSVEEENGSPAP